MCTGRPRDCDDSDECTVDTCDEEEDLCVNERDPLCGMDHHKCYRTRPKGWRFAERNVMLEDQFGASEMTVERLKYFCNPTDKNGEGIHDPTAHMACYKTSRPKGMGPSERRSVLIENQFGQLNLLVVRADLLCVPAEKDSVPSPLNIDHFECYKVRAIPRFDSRVVTLGDQFETKETVVIKPKLLCNPVDKNGEGILNPEGHLVCYTIKDADGQPKFSLVDLEMEDQFSDDTLVLFRGECRKSSVLCVPSTKRLASPGGAFLELTTDLLD
jgi:hypothetical protein